MQVQSLGQQGSLEKEIATHSSVLAWKIPRTEEPGRLQRVAKDMGERLNTHGKKQTEIHAKGYEGGVLSGWGSEY